MESNGHPPLQHNRLARLPPDRRSTPHPDILLIHLQYHVVDRYYLQSADDAVILGSEEHRRLYQRSLFIRKKLLLSDCRRALGIVSNEVYQLFVDAQVSFHSTHCLSLAHQIVCSEEVTSSCTSMGTGVQVGMYSIEVHRVIAGSVGDGMVPAEETAVKALLEKETAEVKGDGNSCVVCMEELPRGTRAVRMPCSHVFHGACIRRWLENSHCCPVCRYEMPPST